MIVPVMQYSLAERPGGICSNTPQHTLLPALFLWLLMLSKSAAYAHTILKLYTKFPLLEGGCQFINYVKCRHPDGSSQLASGFE